LTGRITQWLVEDLTWGGVLLGASLLLASVVGSLFAAGFVLVKLPPTYFQEFHARDFWVNRHPVLRVTARSGKNLVGALLVVVGALLALPGVPGQGLLTILVGLLLLDVPGKRRLERRLIGRPRILRTINRMRKRFGAAPLVLGNRRGEVLRSRLAATAGADRGAGGARHLR
jgi:hypothetical protein